MKGSGRRETRGSYVHQPPGGPLATVFLEGAGRRTAVLPLLQYEEAFGACAAVPGPERMFIVAWSLGMLGGDTWATTGDNWVLPAQMASLAPYRQDLLLLDGLDYPIMSTPPCFGAPASSLARMVQQFRSRSGHTPGAARRQDIALDENNTLTNERIAMKISLLVTGMLLSLAVLASPGAATTDTSGSKCKAKALVWQDVNGSQVAVISVDALDQMYQVLDGQGQIWFYDYGLDQYTAVSPGIQADGLNPYKQNITTLYYQTPNCSGAPYISPLPSRSTVGTPLAPDSIRIVPNDVHFTNITALSVWQGTSCDDAGSTPMRVIRFDTLPPAQPRGVVGTPPFHPTTITLN